MIGALGVVVSSIVAIWGLPAAIQSANVAQQAEDRERKKDKEEEEEERRHFVGPAISITADEPNLLYGGGFAFVRRTTEATGLPSAGFMTSEYVDWFTENKGVPIGERTVRVTVFPIHEGTVVIQNMRVTKRSCHPSRHTGTLVVPPAFGDSGGESLPTTVAFDLTEPVPRPWKLAGTTADPRTGEPAHYLSGNAFAKTVYLDGGENFDARAFDLTFLTGSQDCVFGVDVNVTTRGRGSEWYPVTFPGYAKLFEVAGNAGRYGTSVVSTSMEGRPQLGGPRSFRPRLSWTKGSF
ncbi:hypothetical protein ABT160_27245 [Streptomyces sp. NPDC001941]|uniref:hypothetical protein n=1 Tax=Streptomyces sp. NPDC001941 TaxID=3154659 RepID=UPI0033233DCF